MNRTEGDRSAEAPPASIGRRVAVGMLGVLAALVAGSLIWDVVSGGDGPHEAGAESASPAPQTTHTTSTTIVDRPTTETSVVPLADGGTGLAAAVEGFEDSWLLVVNRESQTVWQVSLADGEATLLGRADRVLYGWEPAVRAVGGYLVGPEGGVSLSDGSTWSTQEQTGEGDGVGALRGGPSRMLGTTGDDTFVTYDYREVRELAADGTVLARHDTPAEHHGMWEPAGFAAGQVLFQGSHGLLALHPPTGEIRRIGVGRLVATTDSAVIVDVCDDGLRCTRRLADAVTGDTLADLGAAPLHVPDGPTMAVTVSPDGERAVWLDGSSVVFVDLTSGVAVGAIDLELDGHVSSPSDPRHPAVHAVWSAAGDAALVLVTSEATDRDQRGVQLALVADRELLTITRRDDLAAAFGPILRFGGRPSFHLVTDEAQPWG